MSGYELIDPDGSVFDRAAVRPLPEAQLPGGLHIREAELDDLPWIDAQQKAKENRQRLGFLFESALIGKIEKKQVLVAESGAGFQPVDREATPWGDQPNTGWKPVPLGYLIAQDRYLKRDDLGLVVQMCVAPAYRRSFVAAHLLKAQFDRSAYGCKLYCCWCAQDLEANQFWESMGFVPLAFRTGSPREKVKRPDGSKGPRIHIFWQKRIRQGDGGPGDPSGGTPYWYPSETSGGAIGASRIVLPIPLRTHWSEAKPAVLPAALLALPPAAAPEEDTEQPSQNAETQRRVGKQGQDGVARSTECESGAPGRVNGVNGFGVGFGPSPEEVKQREAERAAAAEAARLAEAEAKRKQQAARKKDRERLKTNEPALCAYSRELRDRWLEATAPGSEGARMLEAAGVGGVGGYDVARALDGPRASVFLSAGAEQAGALPAGTTRRVEATRRLAG